MDVAGGALAQRLDRSLLVARGGHQHHRHVRVAVPHLGDQLQAVDLGHHQVGEHQVGQPLGHQLQRLPAAGGVADLEILMTLDEMAGQLALDRRVVDDEDERHLFFASQRGRAPEKWVRRGLDHTSGRSAGSQR